MINWIIHNFKAAVMLFTLVIIPMFGTLAGFAYGFYGKVIDSERDNVAQYRELYEIKQGFISQKASIDIMKGNMDSIKEDTSAIKQYFMKRAVEK